jgi:hypothetical protein
MYIGNDLQIAHPSYKIIDDISSGFNGSQTSFALQVSGATPVPFPISTQQVMISVNGVVQEPDPNGSAGFKLLGSNIVFSSAPANGHAFFGVINAGADYVTAGSEFPDGSATAPSFTFQDDQDTGWFRSGSGAVGFSANGVNTIGFDGNGLTVTGDATFAGDSSKNLFWDKSDGQLEFADNAKAVFGTGSDLQIYHDGNHSYIDNTGTGNLYLKDAGIVKVRTGTFGVDKADGTETMMQMSADGAVELYYNGSKKYETTSGGIDVDGSVTADDIITAGALLHEGDTDTLVHFSAANTIDLKTGGVTRLTVNNTGVNLGANLYTSGKNISLGDSSGATDDRITVGDSQDLQIYHDGSNSYLVNGASGGNLYLQTYGENSVKSIANGAVELYYDGTKRLETVSTGAKVTGDFQFGGTTTIWDDSESAFRLGDNNKIEFGNSDDLQIYHDGNHSYIKDTGTGELRLSTSQFTVQNAAGDETLLYAVDGGAVGLKHSDSLKLETTSSGVTVTGTVSDSKGDLRKIIKSTKSSAYTLVAADAGKAIYTDSGVTVNNSVLGNGDAVTVINQSGSDITITQGSGVTIFNTADATTGNRTLAGRGMATLWFADPSTAYISGAGLS